MTRIVCGMGVVLLTVAGCRTPEAVPQAKPAEKAPAQASALAGVTLSPAAVESAGIVLAAVESVPMAGQIVVPGVVNLDDSRTARVGSLQEGLILKTLAQVGDRVTQGQLLATMHGHAMHDAWAGYRKAVAERERLEAELAYATDAHARTERLLVARAVAAQDVRRAAVEREGAAQRLAEARAEVTRSIEELEHVGVHVATLANGETSVREAQADEAIPVRSPMPGVVLERHVTPGTTVVPGAVLYTVSDLASLWVVAEVDEASLPQVAVGRTVGVRVAAYPDETFPGTISFIGDVVNPQTRRVTVRATVANRDRRLKPEMFASVVLATRETRPSLVVPRAAVQSLDGRTVVFVAGTPGRFEPRTVTLGAEAGGNVEVTEGLAVADRVVAAGGFALKSALLAPAGGN